MHIHNYGTEQLWTILCDRTLSMEVKLQAMAVYLKKIGVKFISEKTRLRQPPSVETSLYCLVTV